jgi:CRISPR/Cas system-associated exonuclease Cas4 (RecB family)
LKFHKIVRQHLAGIPESQIEQSLGDDEEMSLYWSRYKHSLADGILGQLFQLGNKHYEELSISIPMGNFRLVAKYDALIERPDKHLIILDWKTSHMHPSRKWLADRLQTHVYPYVLAHQAAGISDGEKVEPDKIEMIYWFTNKPDEPEHFHYNDQAFHDDERYLGNLVSIISHMTEPVYPLTSDQKPCLFCTYRSFCNRGVKPGNIDEFNEWQELEYSTESVTINYEQIGEIEF